MANATDQNPWVLDTAGVITTNAPLRCNLRWVGATTAAHTCIVKDNNGKVVWASQAAGANNVEADLVNPALGIRLNFLGFNLDTIQSGKLYVEII